MAEVNTVGLRIRDPSCNAYPSWCIITTGFLPTNAARKSQSICQKYCPGIEPVKGIRIKPPALAAQGCGTWTNLTYYPLIQGGFAYRGVQKLIPYGPPPSSPVLCRPVPLKPTDSPGVIVYSAP